MLDKFIDREEEIEALNKRFAGKKAEFVVIYGKRRVGKTEIIKKFFEKIPHIYFLADKREIKDQLWEISQRVGEFFNDSIISKTGFNDWITLFEYLKRKNEHFVFVIDEFPYLIDAERAITSLFQKGWDEYLSNSKIFLILCGSSISMMENEVLGYKSPLYGRRTGQMEIKPFGFKEVIKFFPHLSFKENIEVFSVLGGVPAYLKQFDESKNLWENISENILKKDSFLYNEVEFILREELKEPRRYFSILKEIAMGRTKVNEIAQSMDIERNILSRYLSILEELKILKREIPITEEKGYKSRKGIYKIDDNYFKFWFKFVYPNKGYVEEGLIDYILEKKIKPYFNAYVSFVFEEICKETLWLLNKEKKLPFMFDSIGSWWHGENEIDIVAFNKKNKSIIFSEVKWQEKKMGKDAYDDLLEKKEKVKWKYDDRKEYFIFFSKNGFTSSMKRIAEKENIRLYDLGDIREIITG